MFRKTIGAFMRAPIADISGRMTGSKSIASGAIAVGTMKLLECECAGKKKLRRGVFFN